MKPLPLPPCMCGSITKLVHGLMAPTALHKKQLYMALRTGCFMTGAWQGLTHFPLKALKKKKQQITMYF